LGRIFAVLGTPTEEDWANMSLLSDFTPFEARQGRPLAELFPAYSSDAIDLLSMLLRFDPARRPSAAEALAHRYFTSSPLPTPPPALPKLKVKAKPE
jgi:cyclin-dependent kinase 7